MRASCSGLLRQRGGPRRGLEVGELEAGSDGTADGRERRRVIDRSGEEGAAGNGDLELLVRDGPTEVKLRVGPCRAERMEGQRAALAEVPRLVLPDAVEGGDLVARQEVVDRGGEGARAVEALEQAVRRDRLRGAVDLAVPAALLRRWL